MNLTQDQLNIAQVSGFTVAERIDTPETVVTIFTKNGTDITNEFTKVVELLTNSDAEPVCDYCNGSGEATYMAGGGEDAYEQLADCHKCKGTGSASHSKAEQDTERAWLVEKTIKGYPHYLYVPCTGLLDWTSSNSQAIRFARREDASMMCNLVEDADRVAEHMWCY